MSIPPNSPGRGCAANFAQPVSPADVQDAENLVNTVHRVNCDRRNQPLDEIVYRPGVLECDVLHRLFRWDTRPYNEIMDHGFRAWPQEGTSADTYYDLHDFVSNAGEPLQSDRTIRHGFVSTTLNTDWRPNPSGRTLPEGEEIQIYRYEVYAPGGIWVAATLGSRYEYTSQDEICFVGGIAPQYIRSAQLFNASREAGSRFVRIRRADNIITINRHFNPLSDPSMDLLLIQTPVFYYVDENNRQRMLTHQTYPPETENMRKKRDVLNYNSDNAAALKWYGKDVADAPCYIKAAFRSTKTNEAYLFMKNEYVLINYAPHTTDDSIKNGPLLICDGFPSLIGTSFGEHGIDCAFDTDYDTGFPFYSSKSEAFIFSANLCAYIDYAPGTTNDKIISGPMTIVAMFPFFKGTDFEDGVDAAFRSTRSHEAYLFRGKKCALINYDTKNLVKDICDTSDEFPCLLGTDFAHGIDAAFASHEEGEAYLFKKDLYTLIHYDPSKTDDSMVHGRVKPILSNWPSLKKILPCKNGGLDFHNHRH